VLPKAKHRKVEGRRNFSVKADMRRRGIEKAGVSPWVLPVVQHKAKIEKRIRSRCKSAMTTMRCKRRKRRDSNYLTSNREDSALCKVADNKAAAAANEKYLAQLSDEGLCENR
jgi:hypothetical protein